MGLEVVEIVMDIEEEFGVSLQDQEVSLLQPTVGSLVHYVQSKVDSLESDRCATAAAFYRLRRFFIEELNVQRGSIRPDTRLEDLIPIDPRRTLWQKLAPTLPLRIRSLERPSWVHAILGITILAVIVGLFISWTWVLAGLLAGFLVYVATQPLATRFPGGCQTMRDLAHRVARPAKDAGRLSDEEIAHKVRLIVCDNLAIPIGELTDDKRLF